MGFRYAFRSWRRSPGVAIAAIVTLALGIGANTAIFSVLHGVVLDPLPYPQPDRLVVVALYNRALGYPTNLSYPDFLDWQRNSRSFEQIAAFVNEGFDLTSPGAPEHVDGKQVSAGFFATLGVPLAAGRGFTKEEDQPGGVPAVVITDRLWEEHFDRDPTALGRNLTLNGVDYTIVGVLRPEFRFGDQQTDAYTSIARRNALFLSDRTVHDTLCIARLRAQASPVQALAEMTVVQKAIVERNPGTERGQEAYVIPLKQFLIGDVGETLLLLLGAVGLVLLIACSNVANLLLARSAARTREFAIRLALGASRAQIVRQLLAESVVLFLGGGLMGLTIAKWGVSALLASAAGTLPRTGNVSLNAPVLLFAFAVSLFVGIAFGLVPALRSSKTDVQNGLSDRGWGTTRTQGTQRILVVLQVAVALVLMVGGGLLLRTIHNLWAVNPGFNPQHVLTFQVGLSRTITQTPSRIRVAYQELTERIRRIPGVEAAGITALVPFSGGSNEGPFWIGPEPPASMPEIPRAIYYPTGPGYLAALQIPLLEGRVLNSSDSLGAEVVVLVDRLLARRFFPDRNPIGQSITIPHWGARRNVPARIAGVVEHVEHYGLDGSMAEKPQIYFSLYQLPDEVLPAFRSEVSVAVRTRRDATGVMPAIQNAVLNAGSAQPIYNVHSMSELVSGSMRRQRFPMILLVAFAILALLLASIGVYGVIAYSTARRAKEIGVRMALGAEQADVLRLVLSQGLRLASAGVAIGTLTVLVLARAVPRFSRLLFEVGPNDPVILATVSLLLIGVAALACYLPARRAADLDANAVLRQE